MRQVLFPLCAFGLIAIAVPVQAGPIRNFLQSRGIGKQSSTPMMSMPTTTTVTPATPEPPMAPGTTPSTSGSKTASTDSKVTPASAADTPSTTAGTKTTNPATTMDTMPMQPQYMPTSTSSGRRHLLPFRNRG